MNLSPIDKESGLNKDRFKTDYLDPLKPVVFTDLIDDWPAKTLWTIDYFKEHYGNLIVPIIDSSFSKGGKSYMSATATMKFKDYLDLIQTKETPLRIFLWNIFKYAPQLAKDIRKFNIMNGFYNELPFMFFGGQGSYTKIHYDIDCSHVFLTQFQTRKRILLFDQQQSKYLHHVPFTVGCLVDMIDPDESKYPSLKYIHGYETILEHGQTLFIPSMYWHHIEYIEGGFSISFRASNTFGLKLKGAVQLAKHFAIDRSINYALGNKWMDIKLKMAKRNAHLDT
ncbi:MAG: cupin-like domain-containing protein [Saprospiraceae bacterium]